jgi:hypothetical protein
LGVAILLAAIEQGSMSSRTSEMLTPDAAVAPEQVELSTDAEPKSKFPGVGSKFPGVALLRQASGMNKDKLPDLKQIPGMYVTASYLAGPRRTARHASTH